jgi:hypothetical protein
MSRREVGAATARSALLTVVAYATLFLGGGVVGLAMAEVLAPGSWLAQAVSFFALPVAFASSLQMWYGLALLSVIPRLFALLRGSRVVVARSAQIGPPGLPGSFVFLPIGSAVGALAGVLVGILSPTRSVWLVAPVYWLVGTAHGLLAWRLARAGYLFPPETI